MKGRHRGRLSLWIHVNAKGEVPAGTYAAAADISQGTGASNSVIVVYNILTREKVAEFVSPHIRPDELAKYAVALCKWFHGAFLIWEANGPGRIFGDVVISVGYRNIYWRPKDERKVSKSNTDIPGFYSTGESKNSFLGGYRKALANDEIINRSKRALAECLEYVFLPNGSVAHSASTRDEDPSGARESHGDRVIADALAYKAMEKGCSESKPVKTIEPGSLMFRRQQRQSRQREKQSSMWN